MSYFRNLLSMFINYLSEGMDIFFDCCVRQADPSSRAVVPSWVSQNVLRRNFEHLHCLDRRKLE